MTSERATHANRRNAQASTGPRTPAGKARSGQNAWKHGLTAADPHPETEAGIEALAVLLAGEHVSDAAVLEAARNIAEVQFQLQRIKSLKILVVRAKTSTLEQGGEHDKIPCAEIFPHILDQLENLERYERRALSRRKFAARRMNELVGLASCS